MMRTSYVLAIGIAAMMAVGRVYDERLSFAGFNVSLVISAAFALVLALGVARVLGTVRHAAGEHAPAGAPWSYVVPLLLFGAWAGVHTVLVPSDDPSYAQEKLVTFALITLPACLLVVHQRSEHLVRALLVCFACVGGALIVLSLPSIVGVLTGEAGYGRAAQRLSLFGGGPIVYARWVLTAALVVALSRVRLALKLAAVLAALLAAVLAQSKGPVMFFAMSLAVVPLLRALVERKMVRSAGIVVATVGIAAIAPRIIEAMGVGGRLLALFDPRRLMQETSSTARLDVLGVSAQMIRDHPFGVGLGNWGAAAGDYVISGRALSYPHNLFVEVASELGILLGIALGLWILWCAGRSVRGLVGMVRERHPRSEPALLVLALFTFYFLSSIVSGDLSDARLLFVTLAMLVVITAEPVRDAGALGRLRPLLTVTA